MIVGSVTDFDSYYPPRMAMTVHWYAANEGFHPIPAGYGLPWGTDRKNRSLSRIAREAEFELARSQLATQTPSPQTIRSTRTDEKPVRSKTATRSGVTATGVTRTDPHRVSPWGSSALECLPVAGFDRGDWRWADPSRRSIRADDMEAPLPLDWPDPTDLIPDPPCAAAPDRDRSITSPSFRKRNSTAEMTHISQLGSLTTLRRTMMRVREDGRIT